MRKGAILFTILMLLFSPVAYGQVKSQPLTAASGIRLQATSPGTQQTGNINISGKTITGALDVSAIQTSGTLFNLGAPSAVSLAGALTGFNLNLSTNYTATGFGMTGQAITLPAVTNTGAGTYAYKALVVTTGALVQNTGAGTNTWAGLDITMPNLTQTTGSVTSYGLKITRGSITSGTDYFLYMTSTNFWTGVGAIYCSGGITAAQAISVLRSNIQVTPTTGFTNDNATDATSGVPVQMSPRLRFAGSVWNTTVTAAANYPYFTIDNLPVSGTAPTAGLRFNYSLSTSTTASYTELARLDAVSATAGNWLVGLTVSPTSMTKGIACATGTPPSGVVVGASLWASNLNGGSTGGWQFMNQAGTTVYTVVGCSGVVANSTGAATILDIGAAPTVNTGWMTVINNLGVAVRIPYW